jgi:hypothetical protein
LDMASPHSDMLKSRLSLMNSGKLEAVRTDHRKRIDSVPQEELRSRASVTSPNSSAEPAWTRRQRSTQ